MGKGERLGWFDRKTGELKPIYLLSYNTFHEATFIGAEFEGEIEMSPRLRSTTEGERVYLSVISVSRIRIHEALGDHYLDAQGGATSIFPEQMGDQAISLKVGSKVIVVGDLYQKTYINDNTGKGFNRAQIIVNELRRSSNPRG